ncbi:hypothetical protein TNCV_983401 [Trichonephila clavipes]|nr:hypothetical protein TNCV_983401 [Trichonephila clavipes]
MGLRLQHLLSYRDDFVKHIVAENETWFHHFQLEVCQNAMETTRIVWVIKIQNSAVSRKECNMSGCMEDTSLRIASFSSDRLDGPDRYTRDFKYPHNQKSAGVKSGDR